jgi:hypothetical protein
VPNLDGTVDPTVKVGACLCGKITWTYSHGGKVLPIDENRMLQWELPKRDAVIEAQTKCIMNFWKEQRGLKT